MDSQGAGHKQNIINYRQTRVHNTNKKSSSEYFHTLTLSRPKEKLSHNFKPSSWNIACIQLATYSQQTTIHKSFRSSLVTLPAVSQHTQLQENQTQYIVYIH